MKEAFEEKQDEIIRDYTVDEELDKIYRDLELYYKEEMRLDT